MIALSVLLLVDDDDAARSLYARALHRFGEIRQADRGTQALRMLADERYDLVLLDLHMPVVDGFAILEELAKGGPNQTTPVFVVTADHSEEARLRAMRRHGVFLLTKPIPIAALVAMVEGALRRKTDVPRRSTQADEADPFPRRTSKKP